ncbi:hypothetical protein BKA61DRAFT_585006 [Leptodontidium sp. MPI-SDFR-AT-0119]|nr:hypothetical protein BKA61DRAFT_585006 [Leptodontidium sp. MPI-SDFR-AT-0119]
MGISLEARKKEIFDSQGFTEEDLLEPGDAELMSNISVELADELDKKEDNSKPVTSVPPTRTEWRLQDNLSTETLEKSSTTPSKSAIPSTKKMQPLGRDLTMKSPLDSKNAISGGCGKSSFLTFRKVITCVCILLAFGAALTYLNGISFKLPLNMSPNLNTTSYFEAEHSANQPIYVGPFCLTWSNGSSELNDMATSQLLNQLLSHFQHYHPLQKKSSTSTIHCIRFRSPCGWHTSGPRLLGRSTRIWGGAYLNLPEWEQWGDRQDNGESREGGEMRRDRMLRGVNVES